MNLEKLTVLVAGADPQFLRFVRYNLQLEGYNILSTSDGEQALAQIALHTPDLVLLDTLIPKLNGCQVCKRVRAFSSVPILLLNVRGKGEEKIQALDLVADDYLTKPFSIDELLARMRAMLRCAQLTARA